MIADAPIVLSTIFVLATLSVLLYYDYNLARKKGFRYPGAICLVAAFWMAALALASAVYSLLPESLQEKDYLFFSFLILIALVITPAFKLLLQALPTRSVRVYGQRRVRVPFIFLGTVVILVSSVALLNGIAGAIFGIPTGLYMILLGRRLRSPQAPAFCLGTTNLLERCICGPSSRSHGTLFTGIGKNIAHIQTASRRPSPHFLLAKRSTSA